MTRFLLYGGKGGVGKTTMAAATGLQLADAGQDTLVVSTDPAHSLADAYETPLGGDPVQVRDRLWAVEVDPQAGIDRYQAIFEALADEFETAGIHLDDDDIAALFGSGVMPGSDELAAIEGLAAYIESDRWDRIVFDTAPTGHTLRLLDLPSVMDRGMATALDLRDQIRRKVSTARTMMFGPLAGGRREGGPDDFTAMRERLERVGKVLRDPEQTSFRVVTIPETMAVRETERLVAQLREFEVPVTALVVNKVIEDPGDCERCQGKHDVQEAAMASLAESLPDLSVVTVPDESGEVTGSRALERVGAQLDV